jgi:hypothetical protein
MAESSMFLIVDFIEPQELDSVIIKRSRSALSVFIWRINFIYFKLFIKNQTTLSIFVK